MATRHRRVVAAVHPVAAPATGTRLADLSPSAGLRLWRLKPNAVAPRGWARSAAAACSAAAWRFCAAPRRPGSGAPRRHPGSWYPSGGPSPPAGLRLWRLKPNAVAPRSRAGSATHPPSPWRLLAGRQECGAKHPNPSARKLAQSAVQGTTLGRSRHRPGRARNLRTLTGTGAERDGRREAPPWADDYLPELAHGASPRKVAGMRRKASCAWVTAIKIPSTSLGDGSKLPSTSLVDGSKIPWPPAPKYRTSPR